MEGLGNKGKPFKLVFEQDYTKPITKEEEEAIKQYMRAWRDSLRLQYLNALSVLNFNKL